MGGRIILHRVPTGIGIVPVVDVTIESLRDGDEEAAHALAEQSFGPSRPYDPVAVSPPNSDTVAAYQGDTLVGRLKVLDSAQWFGGRSVSMGGIGGVVVAPEARGQRIAQRLLDEALHRMHADGRALSTLYPTTATLYRSRGYEFAGSYTVPALRVADADLDSAVRAEPITWDDARVRALYNRVSVRRNGWLDRTDYTWASVLQGFHKKDRPHYLYGMFREDDELVAVVGYTYQPVADPDPAGELFDIDVHMLFAADGAGFADALSFLARNGTTGRLLKLLYPIDELRLSVRHGQRVRSGVTLSWMSRLVDAPAAIAARGYLPDVDAEVHLAVHDPTLVANQGPHVLRVANGVGSLEPGGRAEAHIDCGDFASLYTGYADPGFLANAGRLAGAEPPDVDALRRAFAGPPPTIVDFF